MHIVLQIFTQNILPIFILVTLGYLVSRKFALDTGTLNKINFWLFVPVFTFTNLYITDIGVSPFAVAADFLLCFHPSVRSPGVKHVAFPPSTCCIYTP